MPPMRTGGALGLDRRLKLALERTRVSQPLAFLAASNAKRGREWGVFNEWCGREDSTGPLSGTVSAWVCVCFCSRFRAFSVRSCQPVTRRVAKVGSYPVAFS